ncbi:uncharacterized protein CC84DRAFT_1255775 [Paraphaeosphaeria sporulosa]|uniref:Apple domain-containing protein n=1 Tax=Paraphaeosphaeria sporulosa TaxID=1460663 RepID=A0A177CRA0_9PLEO|nr:uncharacterized protein CC84DRAFT_1255775 [Paraphaeosphaeria sporulosa]OAG09826.1 hypothetical protein CC84DRAFT_1255775 [Paraphaeosphaeria sporulosa]
MHSYSAIVLALSAAAAAAPLAARSNVCGVAPSASSTSKAPLETFTNAQTAEQCYADCAANASCKSFLFGLVDGTIKCELFDVPAAQIPKQDSSNLVAFDKACTSIPDVKPTTANPQGLAEGSTNTQASNTNEKANAQQKTDTTATQKAATKITQNTVAKVSQKAAPKASQKAAPKASQIAAPKASQIAAPKASQKAEAKTTKETEQKKTSTSTSAKTCGAAPAGSGNVEPFNTPANINSLEACIAACKKNTSCKSVEFGKLTAKGANVCRFFSVAAAQIPKATAGQSFQVSDIACA